MTDMDAAPESQGPMEDKDPVLPEPTLTVAAVARRMGVAPPTLRTWDRRYGLGPSMHTAGAHRRYTSADVARLLVMRRLTLEGVSPADAAKIAKATPIQIGQSGVSPADHASSGGQGSEHDDRSLRSSRQFPSSRPGFGDSASGLRGVPDARPGTSPAPVADSVFDAAVGAVIPLERSGDAAAPFPGSAVWPGRPPAEETADQYSDSDLVDARRAAQDDRDDQADAVESPWRDEPDGFDEPEWLGVLREAGGGGRGSAGGGRVVALPYGTPQSRGLARAAMALDTFEMGRLLRDALRREGTVSTWKSMIMPVLRALGERNAVTGDGIDVEHAFSEVVLGALRGVVIDMQQPRNASPVLLACTDGDYHSLPLHALAAALAERQVACRMLGSGLPPHALSASVRRTGPSVIVLYAQMQGADAGPTQALRRQRPAPAVVLAGPGWTPSTIPSFARPASSLIEAIDEVLLGIHL